MDRLINYTAGNNSQTYAYDANSNRTSLKIGAKQYNYTTASTSNRLLSLTGPTAKTFSYDAAGNITGDGSNTLTWNAQGRLKTVTLGTNINTYLYNGLGERLIKIGAYLTNAPYRFVYDSAGHLIGEYDSNNVLRQETVWLGDIPVAIFQRDSAGVTQLYYLQTDHLNTPRAVLNNANLPIWRWDNADPFGNTAPNTDPDGDGKKFEMNLRFPGQYYDVETGLFYNYFRDYNPTTGRYIASDPIGLQGGLNTYGYVGGNPVARFDPFGLDSLSFDGSLLTHFDNSGNIIGIYPATSGVPGTTDPSIPGKGPIPPGNYSLNPSEISPAGFLRIFLDPRDWGSYRAPLHPDPGTDTLGRDGFMVHGGKKPGSAGCIDIGSGDKKLFPQLQKLNSPVPLTVSPYVKK